MARPRLLVINYEFPPAPSVGGVRWLAMRKYLGRLGYDVSVLTTSAYGRLPDDESQGVVRTADLTASTFLRRLLRRHALGSGGDQPARDPSPPALLTKVVVPEIYAATWVPFAIPAMRRLLRERRIDAVVSSSPKDSAHLVGLAPRGADVAWIAEFRDGWSNEGTRPPFPTAAQRALDAKLEARIVQGADAVVAVTDELAVDFRRRFGVLAVCVPNGWDPELAGAAESELAPERPVRIVYTGTMTGAEGAASDRSPVPLLEAFELFSQEDPELAGRIELVIAGRLSARDESMLSRFAHLDVVRHVGNLPRLESMSLQRSADVLLLITGEATASPAKLFEYLGARRPVLHLGRPGAASRILQQTTSGVTIAPDDPQAIVEQLRLVAASRFELGSESAQLERYSYPAVAERMAEVVEEAVASRARRRRAVPRDPHSA